MGRDCSRSEESALDEEEDEGVLSKDEYGRGAAHAVNERKAKNKNPTRPARRAKCGISGQPLLCFGFGG